MFKLSDFDFDLPADLIAQTALPTRSASRLLEVGKASRHARPARCADPVAPVDPAACVGPVGSADPVAPIGLIDPADAESRDCRARAPTGLAPATLTDRHFADLPDCLAPGDLLVFNDTKVLKARFFGQKPSGGKVEVLIERLLDARTARAQIRASKSPAPGSTLRLADAFDVTLGARAEPFYTLHFPTDCLTLIERYGHLPLPPYIAHAADATDEARYQTVFARHPGAVAAPTAGLHFDDALLARLDARGIERATLTLHVGAGTFQPVRVENIAEHRMHREWYELPATLPARINATHARGGRVIAVGTTSLRALEAAARDAHAQGRALAATTAETDIFITPGYTFRIVDRLVTNFHLPKSTLLMLVCAFAGIEPIRAAYQHAIRERYRFFSYGDAMLLTRAETQATPQTTAQATMQTAMQATTQTAMQPAAPRTEEQTG